MPPDFARALVRIRVILAMSQVKFAQSIGVDHSTVANIEHRRNSASQNVIDRIRERYGIDLYVFAWALGRRERIGIEIVQGMEVNLKTKGNHESCHV